jgi:radical SAM protein with 4Fe4S-binding SPASM domain
MITLATDLKAEYSFSTELTKRYDNTAIAPNIALDYEDLKYLLKSEYKNYFDHSNEDKNLQCECARTVCGIGANGNLYPCIGAPVYSGNLIEQSFEEIWKNSSVLNNIRNLKSEDFKTCNSCNLLEYCGRSSGGAYVNTGNYTGKNPEDCQMANARKEFLSL